MHTYIHMCVHTLLHTYILIYVNKHCIQAPTRFMQIYIPQQSYILPFIRVKSVHQCIYCIHVRIYTCVYISTDVFLYLRMYGCMNAYWFMYYCMNYCRYVCASFFTFISMYVCNNIYTHVGMYICVYVYIYRYGRLINIL